MKSPWILTRATDGSLSLIDANDPSAAEHPTATHVKPTEANLLRVAPVMRGVLSEMNHICTRMFVSLPADREPTIQARRDLLDRANAVLKASHETEPDAAPPAPPSAQAPTFSDRDIEELAHEALNAACLLMQNRLGVTTGDLAGIFFSGKDPGGFEAYIRSELRSTNQGEYVPARQQLMQIEGFDLVETGGGCTAIRRILPDGRHIVLTSDASAYVAQGDSVDLGVYPSEDWDPDEGTLLELPSFDAATGAVAAILAESGHIVYVTNSPASQGVTAAIEAGLSHAIGWSMEAPPEPRRPSPRG